MKDSHYQSVLYQSDVGYSYNRIINIKGRNAEGYSILEANSAFELMTGISLEAVRGKNVHDIYPDIDEYGIADINRFSEIAANGGSTSFKKYSSKHHKWFNIHLFSGEREHFATLITEERERSSGSMDIEELLLLSKLLLDSKDNSSDFEKFTSEICRISGADFGVFNLYSQDRRKFRNMAICGNSELVLEACTLLGFSFRGREWEISGARLNEIGSNHIVRYESLFDLARNILPEQLCKAISDSVKVGPAYVVEITAHSNILGDFILFFRNGKEIENMSTVKAFGNMVGIAINRNTVEKKRINSEKNLKNFFNAGIDFHWVLAEDGTIVEINDTVRKRLGYDDCELIGKPVLIVHPPELREEAARIIISMLEGEDIACNIPLLTKSGHHIPVETYVIKGEWNNSPALFGISKDISQLKMSEDKFYKAFNASPEIMGLSTLEDGVYAEVNRAFCDILGYNPSEVIGRSSAEVLNFDPEIRKRIVDGMKRDGYVRNEEVVLLNKAGKPLNLLISADIIRMQDKEYNLTVATDITSRKKMEESIRQSEANLKAIIENTMENIWSVNTRFEIQYVNEQFARAFQLTFGKELIIGNNIIEALPENLQEIWRERYIRCFQNEHFIFEDRIDAGDREIYVEVAMNPIIVDGKVLGASLYGKDVTEKKISQLQLQYQADLRKLLVELSSRFINIPVTEIGPEIYASLEKIGEFVGADRVYVFEYDFDKMTATNTLEWCREGISRQKENLQNVPLENFISWVEIHKRGESIKIADINDVNDESLKRQLVDQNIKSLLTIPLLLQNNCFGFVGFESVATYHTFNDYEHQLLQVYAQMLVNVNERIDKENKLVKAKEMAEESGRLKTAFLANMSHEIRTPMNGILGFLELLKEPDLSEDNKATYIDIVTQSGQRLLTTLNDIIEISKIEAGEMKVNNSDVDTEKIMVYFSNFFKPQASAKKLELRLKEHIKGKASVIRTDRNKIENAILNLLKNAVKFTVNGSVSLGNFISDNSLVFYVTDTGPGIAPEKLSVVFERFVQGDMSASRSQEGSGLGLSIVKGYAAMLGGKVWAESEAGKGSTFYFSVPYITSGEKAAEKNLESSRTGQGNGEMTILVVEDDYAGYLFLEQMLTLENYKVIRKTDGIETVEFVRDNNDIGLILMDLKIQGISGLETTRQIRQFNKEIPIIAQTAYAFDSNRQEAIEAGCNDYISKPISRDNLLRLIHKYSR